MSKSRSISSIWIVAVVVITVFMVIPEQIRAGNLDPTTKPASTMKTLDEVEPRIAIPASETPVAVYTISESGSYYLTGDRLCNGVGIQVDVDNVTIDLMGYSLIGPGSGTDYGIRMIGRRNVEIRNGTVRSFYVGIIEEREMRGHRIIGVRLFDNLRGGLFLASYGNRVKDCTVSNNGVYGMRVGNSSTVTGNVAYRNGTSADDDVYGIQSFGNSVVTNNTVSENGMSATNIVYGIRTASGCTLTNNTSFQNGSRATGNVYGIYADSGSTVVGNTARGNGSSAGGTVYGIYVYAQSLVDRNTAYVNKDTNLYCRSLCTFGTNHAP